MAINIPFLTCQRRWLILIPFCLSMATGMYLSITLPKIYHADALILAEVERRSGEYVEPLTEAVIGQKISLLKQQISSRTSLERMIQETGLYSEPEYGEMFPEDKIARMRKNMELEITMEGTVEIFTESLWPLKMELNGTIVGAGSHGGSTVTADGTVTMTRSASYE